MNERIIINKSIDNGYILSAGQIQDYKRIILYKGNIDSLINILVDEACIRLIDTLPKAKGINRIIIEEKINIEWVNIDFIYEWLKNKGKYSILEEYKFHIAK